MRVGDLKERVVSARPRRSATFVKAALIAMSAVSASLVSPLGADELSERTPPALDLGQVFPGDQANTIHERQPLVARFVDADRARVDPDSISFRLTDLATNEVTTFDGDAVGYDAATGFAKTKAASLTAGHSYRVAVAATDHSTNRGEWSWDFRAMSLKASAATATIREAPGELVTVDGASGWKFVPRLDVGQFTVTATPTQHSGFGPIGHVVPLDSARVEYRVPGLPGVFSVPAYMSGETVTVYKQFTKLRSEGPNTKTLYGQPVVLAPITVQLPPGVEDPVLRLEAVSAPPTIPALDCADPTEGPRGCTPDPLRFFVAEDFAQDIFNQQQQNAAQSPGSELTDIFVSVVEFLCAPVDPPGSGSLADQRCSAPAPHWAPLHLVNAAIPRAPAEPAVFTSPGAYQWVVPPGVTRIDAWLAGGGGGGVPDSAGAGVLIRSTVPVTAGEVFDIVVGGGGRDRLGGFGGGGDGGIGLVGPCCGGGVEGYGGGGASRISRSGSVLVVAAGGGGMGGGASSGSTSFGVPSGGATTQGGSGGDAGLPSGQDGGRGSTIPGYWSGGFGGKGATATAGGAGGSGTPDPDGQAGTSNTGGFGGSASDPGSGGGGGGGGLYGGGGGEAAWYGGLGGGGGGGGGGVSYVAAGIAPSSVTATNGLDGFVAFVPLADDLPTVGSSSQPWDWDGGRPRADEVRIDGLTFLNGVHYLGGLVSPTPEQFAVACTSGFPCVSNDVAAMSAASPGYLCAPSPCPSEGGAYFNTDVMRKCLFIDGYNRAQDCTQQWAIFDVNVPYGQGANHLGAFWLSQVGIADNTRRGPPPQDLMRSPPGVDAFGITWFDDNHRSDLRRKWDYVAGSADQGWAVLFDWYYNRKDIPDCSAAFASCTKRIPPHRRGDALASASGSFSISQVSGSDPNNGWGYGMAIPYYPNSPLDPNSTNPVRTTAQYYDVCGTEFVTANCEDASGASGEFWGYYNPDGASPVGPRNGMARAYRHDLDGTFNGVDAAQSGIFLISWGHKWTEYTVAWEAGWGISLYPGPVGPGFGLSWKPQEEERASTYFLALRYCFGGSSC